MEIQIVTNYYYYKTMLKGGTEKLCVSHLKKTILWLVLCT